MCDQGHISELEYWDAQHGVELSFHNLEDGKESLEEKESENPYEFIGELGVGAMGEVHIVQESFLRRKVALKFIRTDRANDRSHARFVREALITAQLDHPNIVPIYNYEVELDGNPAYTMKWIKGRTFEEILDECKREVDYGQDLGAPDLFERLDLFIKLCEAMYYAHSKKVLHRDLKPANVMVGPFGELYVMDWGIARVIGQEDLSETSGVTDDAVDLKGDGFDTQDGAIVGTVAYLSPEQARGEIAGLRPASDQYALGLILFELVTLNKGIPRGKLEDMLRRAQRGQMAPFVHYSPSEDVSKELEAIVRKACGFVPEDRYPTMEALVEDLRRYLRDEPIAVYQDPPLTVIMRWVSKHRLQAFALVVSVIIAGLGTSLYSLTREQNIREHNLVREQEIEEALQVRNRRLGQLMADGARQANDIAQEMLHLQGLLRELTASAQSRLLYANTLANQQVYQHTDFRNPSTAPRDLEMSERYQLAISTDEPVVKRAPGVLGTASILQKEIQLVSLSLIFKGIFAQSLPKIPNDDGALDTAIRVTGTPLVWSYVALKEGIHVAYPGKGAYGDDYDARQRPWYQDSIEHRTPTCLPPYEDSLGQGLLLPCTLSVRDQNDNLLGVAGIDLSRRHFSQSSLAFRSSLAEKKVESLLITIDGKVLASHNSELNVGEKLDSESVLKEIKAGRAGYSIIHPTEGIVHHIRDPLAPPTGDLFLFQPVGDNGWVYVVRGAARDLLTSL